ncbi:AAA family ATPase [candidate division CSSED10-310 bacterium]|uniref:AAA family ATPase n=1 Tax=candidate division CSSED10-310 bacterium TaxID=2855610 RepID=A0ABV6YSN3_UNCC1
MAKTLERITIGEVTLTLSNPTTLPGRWVGQQEVLDQVLAAWLVLHERDLPLNPRLIGKPGVGKTSLAYAAGKKLGRDVYIFQATMDTRPEDLIVTPVVSEAGKLKYVSSSLVTAVIRGGVCILDEGNRMSEKSWASLAPLLDHRRYVESLVAGIQIPAHPDFRLATTMNDDASTYELPEYIHSRLQPQIYIDFPEPEEEFFILKENLPFARDAVLRYVVSFLQNAHNAHEPFTVRDGINITRFALKLLQKSSPAFKGETKAPLIKALLKAIGMILGNDAKRYFPSKT